MPRETFDRELAALEVKVLTLGSMVARDLVDAAAVFLDKDEKRARQFIDFDAQVNQNRIDIVIDCLGLIATQQPAASDLRTLAANIEIAGALERIHDHVKGIGKMTQLRSDDFIAADIQDLILEMGAVTSDMLQYSLQAYDMKNAALAAQIPQQEAVVVELYEEGAHALSIPVTIEFSTYQSIQPIQKVTYCLERSANKVLNMCEWIIYRCTGVFQKFG